MIEQILIYILAAILGVFGAHLTNWERKIYDKYFNYLLPIIGAFAVLFLLIDTQVASFLFFILIMGLSWYHSTKLWFNKK